MGQNKLPVSADPQISGSPKVDQAIEGTDPEEKSIPRLDEEGSSKKRKKHDGETAEERAERKRRKQEKKEKKEKKESKRAKKDDMSEESQ